MRRTVLLMATACALGLGVANASAQDLRAQAIPVQASNSGADGWTVGKVIALGAGAVFGVMAANATLPLAWGMANPVIGAVAGAAAGSWAHATFTGSGSMLRNASATRSAEAPSLFQLASFAE